MTLEEFKDIEDWEELERFCNDNNIYEYLEEIYTPENRDDYIRDDVENIIRYDNWTDVRDYLESLSNSDEYERWDYSTGNWYEADIEIIKDNIIENEDLDELFEEDESSDDEEYAVDCDGVIIEEISFDELILNEK